MATKKLLSVLFTGALAASASAADYYVASDGTYEGAPEGATVYTTIDEAIAAAGNADDVIYVKRGEYATTTERGPNLRAKLIGTGTSRDEVLIQPDGAYRTLRMAAGSWLENVTVVGNTDITKVDKGGAIEMSGGTVTNCVVRDGTAKGTDDNNKNAGGNIYSSSTASLIVDCVISGGRAQNRGGNVCLDQGTLRNCTITGGLTSDGSGQNIGGNVWTYQGKIENCTISGGSAVQGGNVYLWNVNASVTGGSLADGTASQSGGNLYMRQGSISGATLSRGATTSNNSSQGGGNVFAEGNGGGATVISSCVLEDGTAKNRGGNAFLLAATLKNSTVSGGKIIDNASGIGGNVFMNNANAIVSSCTVSGGEVDARGGNIFMLAGTVQDSTVKDGICKNPTDQYWGGANIFIQGGKISRCSVTGGSITEGQNRGGGISVQGDPAKVIEDTLVAKNSNGGIYSASSNVQVWNCTIVDNAENGFYRYGGTPAAFANCVLIGNKRSSDGGLANWGGNLLTSALKLASDDSARFKDLGDEFIVIDSAAFADYANGDYKPSASSVLLDAGVTDTRADASTTDLLRNPRTSGRVDIGCYEYQKSEMTVTFAYAETPTHAYAPLNAAFVVSAQNVPEGETPTFTIDFGDGTDPVVTTENSVSHLFENPGVYTVVVRASAPGADNAEMTYEGYVSLASSVVYVTPGNLAPAFPYATPETGYATLKEAYDASVDGMTILVGAGINSVNGQIDVTKAVTIRGAGAAPTDAVLRNVQETADGWKYRVMQVNNAAARIENLTLENGRVLNQYGGNLRVAAGIVSNCVIRGGTATASNGNAAGGGLVLGGQGGIVTHCQIVGNLVDGTSDNKNYAGAAVFVENGTKNGRLSNLLVANNRYVSTDATKSGAAGVRYGGANDHTSLENCTIVSNTVEGTLPEDSAGLYCTSWHVEVRNCVIAGNYETGKQKYTSVKLDFSSGSGFSYLNNVTDDALIQESGSKSKDNQLVSDLAALFKNFDNGDFRPKTGGALVDKGTTTLSLLPSVDLSGNLRQKFAGIDVGCFECPRKLGFSLVIR